MVRQQKCFDGMESRTFSGTLTALGRTDFSAWGMCCFCTADGTRESGARMDAAFIVFERVGPVVVPPGEVDDSGICSSDPTCPSFGAGDVDGDMEVGEADEWGS